MNVASWSVIDMARAVREGSREGCWGGVVVAMPGGVGCLGQIRKEGGVTQINQLFFDPPKIGPLVGVGVLMVGVLMAAVARFG